MQAATKPHRRARTLAVVALTLLAVILAAGCGGAGPAQGEPESEPNNEEQASTETTTGETTAQTGETTGQASEGRGERATIEIGGAPGTEFSGICATGDEENRLDGQVPESFVYELTGEQGLECEIRKGPDDGNLEVTLITTDGKAERGIVSETSTVQQTNAPGGVINLSYSDGGVSFSTTSSGSSGSVSQSSSSSVNQSNSSSSNSR